MKKGLKNSLLFIGVIFGLIILDTLQARLFKHSPIISFKENLEIEDSFIDRGILMDTYYCVKEKDIVEVSWHLKTSNFTCFKATTDEKNGNDNSFTINNIFIKIKDGSLSDKGLTLIINDNTNDIYVFGQEFYVEKLENEVWSKVNNVHTDYTFNLMAYYAKEKTLELKQDWEYMYGVLEKGTYRLIKKVFKSSSTPVTEKDYELISVNFEIE